MANQDFFVVSAVYSAHLPLWIAALAILVERSRAWVFTSAFKYIYFKGTAFEEGLSCWQCFLHTLHGVWALWCCIPVVVWQNIKLRNKTNTTTTQTHSSLWIWYGGEITGYSLSRQRDAMPARFVHQLNWVALSAWWVLNMWFICSFPLLLSSGNKCSS